MTGSEASVRLTLPHHLRNLADVTGELVLEVARNGDGDVTLDAVLGALEARFPVLLGTIRDRASGRRRPFIRFFACQRDLSHDPTTAALPREVAEGREVLIVLGAMAGG
ncbi:hypothetical protein K2X89_06830 [Myxococcota bacterium]|nr:hypothetical protein [Myxococcota bacterium]